MSLSRASTPSLIALACVGVALYAIAERSLVEVPGEGFESKREAVHLMERGEAAILGAKRQRGILIDRENDPEETGLIGPRFSLTTTDRGTQTAKLLATHPNFAAAVTQMLMDAGVGRGDVIAVGMSGSLPGLNLAVFSACKVLDIDPIVITSLGSSMFGATDPGLTWLDMESVLNSTGILSIRSVAASLGGGGDVGRGLSPAGRQLLRNAIERNGVRLLHAPNLLEAVRERVALYESEAASRGGRIRAFVNVGGGVASLGGAQNARLIPAGLTTRLAVRNYPNRGVINVLGERGIPVIHLLNVARVARKYDIADPSGDTDEPGEGPLFVSYRYNKWIVGGAALALLIANFFVLRLDLQQQILGRPHPERNHFT